MAGKHIGLRRLRGDVLRQESHRAETMVKGRHVHLDCMALDDALIATGVRW